MKLFSISNLIFIGAIIHSFSSVSASKYVIGMDAGTESLRVGIFSLEGKLIAGNSYSYYTTFPHPGWAEQNPTDWYNAMGEACRSAINSSDISADDILGVSIDTTACSVVALDEKMQPLRNSLLWMDARSAPQTEEILSKCKGSIIKTDL